MEKIPTLQWAVAAVIHRLRRKAGLSQGQLAGLAGLSEDYISGMERGMSTVLVLSGVSTRATLDEFAYRPSVVLDGVGDIPRLAQ